MRKESPKETKRYIPVMVCPDCVQVGLQIDPRTSKRSGDPAYPVIESVCSTHQPGFYRILIHSSSTK